MRRLLFISIAVLGLCADSTLYAEGISYRVIEILGQAELLEGITGASKPFKEGQWIQVGSVVRTGPDGSVELAADDSLENALRIGPDSQVSFLSFLPIRLSLDEGILFILKEDAVDEREIRILTRSFLAVVSAGGCVLESSGRRAVLKAFSESARIYPKAPGGFSQVPFEVEEGFWYSAEGWERLSFSDYKVWQKWYKENTNRRDEAAGR